MFKFELLVIYCAFIASTFISIASKSVNVEMDSPGEELQAELCNFPKYSPFKRECALFKCNKDRSRVLAIPCPYSPCPAKLSYNEETFSKPYPECCGPPVC